MKYIMIAITSLVFVVGCGGGGDNSPVVMETPPIENPPNENPQPETPPIENPPNENPKPETPPIENPPNPNPPIEVTGVEVTDTTHVNGEGTVIRLLRISWNPNDATNTKVSITGPEGFEFQATSIGASQSAQITAPGEYMIRLVHVKDGVEGTETIESYNLIWEGFEAIPGLDQLSATQYGEWNKAWSGALYFPDQITQTGTINGVVVSKGTTRSNMNTLGVWGEYAAFSVFDDGGIQIGRSWDRNDLTRSVPPAGFRATYQGAAVGLYSDGREEYGRVRMDVVSDGVLFSEKTVLNAYITDMRYTDDIRFLGVTIGPGYFSQDLIHTGRSYQRTELRGNFFGPNHDEAGGTFKADDLTGAFVVVK